MKMHRTHPRRAICALRRFNASQSGSMSVEAVLVAPLLLFGIMFVLTFFSAFQQKGTANKAAYTVADYISRQTDAVDADFIDGMADIYGFLNNQGNKKMRVSSVMWSESRGGKYVLQWSHAADDADALTSSTLSEIESLLPIMSAGTTVLVVEATTRWTPIFSVGLDVLNFKDIVITKPRFATQVIFDD
ncbi:TadE/TadG family type IV pilus assembly protein [Pacificibacter marinus]|uniref:TadE-like protein n=1 Tax=Pacificibacter marinus TaxID=658057 RepID=A0A1Y5SP15_9RHOB|nr:TadE/TadG family type IV pilus assembly protein [Pacificibacter marinus]SEK60370.1 Flp pilus assembly protein TadG [Pacificibacter marinus]SLN42028.1 TadE-like protein [Pacificibacter marinus]